MGILDAPAKTRTPLSCRHTFMPASEQVTQTNNASGLTFRAGHSFLSPPRAVRLIFNNFLDSEITYAQTAAATNSTFTGPLAPAVSNQWQTGGSVTVPARQAENQPSLAYSPWIVVYPVEDAAVPGTYPVVVSCYLEASFASYPANSYAASWMESESKASGGYWTMRQQSGDQITNPGTFSSTTVQNRSPISGIEALCDDGSIISLGIGDSIMSGAGTTNAGQTDYYLACQDANVAGQKISYMNGGWGGQNTATYCARALYLLPIIKPDVLVLSVGSPNDGTPSVTGTRLQRYWIERVIDAARAQGCKVVLRGWAPNTSNSWPDGTVTPTDVGAVSGDAWRRSQNAWAAARAGKGGVRYVAGPAALGDGATPERYQAALTTDLNHPNASGYPVAKTSVLAGLRAVKSDFY